MEKKYVPEVDDTYFQTKEVASGQLIYFTAKRFTRSSLYLSLVPYVPSFVNDF